MLMVPHDKRHIPRALGVMPMAIAKPESNDDLRERIAGAVGDCDYIIVDTFPAGIAGELTELQTPRIAMLRLHRGAHTEGYTRAVASCHRAIDLEAHLGWLDRDDVVAAHPVTMPLAEPEPGDQVDVLIVGGDELSAFADKLVGRLRFKGLTVARPNGFPIAWHTLQPRVVVGAAGFNLTYEALAMDAWHLAIPRPRAHDDQRRRAEELAIVPDSPAQLEELIDELLDRDFSRLQSSADQRQIATTLGGDLGALLLGDEYPVE